MNRQMRYAVIIKSSYHVRGDERSRTNPGHGYPAHNVDYKEIIFFDSEDEMKEWVLSRTNQQFTAIRYETLEVKKTVEVSVPPATRGSD